MSSYPQSPKNSKFRQMWCEHCSCMKIQTHEIRFVKSTYDNTKKEWNVVFHRCCVVCSARNPSVDMSFQDIIGATDWNTLLTRRDLV